MHTQFNVAGILTRPKNKPKSTEMRRLKNCGREVARANELRVCAAIAKFGHLRNAEIGRVVWPLGRWAEQMAQRTCARMVKTGYILKRRNALGGMSYVLTRAGAAWLSLHGQDARHTLELSSVAGATFMHRTLATRFLIERANQGLKVAGEYAIANGQLPFSIDRLVQTLKKLPDGIIWRANSNGRINIDWIEVENAAKPMVEILRLVRVANYVNEAVQSEKNVFLGGLTVVFNAELNHANRLLKAADELWGERPIEKRVQLENSITLVSVSLRSPLVWMSHTTMTLHEYRQKRK